MTIPAYPWHWIEEDLKPKCEVKTLNNKHCPERPKYREDIDVYLCDKCYRNYKDGAYSK